MVWGWNKVEQNSVVMTFLQSVQSYLSPWRFFVEQKDGTSIITEGASTHASGYRKRKNGGTYGVKSKAAVFEFGKFWTAGLHLS